MHFCNGKTMGLIWENAEKISGVAEGLIALFAFAGVVIAWWTVINARNSQREATAKHIYGEYLKLAVGHPDLANPEFMSDRQESNNSVECLKRREQYRWFVASMMNACDEIARIRPGDTGWRDTILEDLKMHIDYLRSRQFVEDGGWRLYSRELKDIYDQL